MWGAQIPPRTPDSNGWEGIRIQLGMDGLKKSIFPPLLPNKRELTLERSPAGGRSPESLSRVVDGELL